MDKLDEKERDCVLKHCYKRYEYEFTRENSISNKCNLFIVCISILLPFILSLSYYLFCSLGKILLFRIELIVFTVILMSLLFSVLVLLFITNVPRDTTTFSSPSVLEDYINGSSNKGNDFVFKLEFNNLKQIINSLAKNNRDRYKLVTVSIILFLIFIGLFSLFTIIILIEYFMI